MGRRRFRSTPESIEKKIAEGRGQGQGPNYRGWYDIQDFPSSGRVHRSAGCKTGRVHHLFSDMEYYVFLIYDLTKRIVDICEQFPLLPLEETLEIARRLGIQHPIDPVTRYPVVMTTDFLLKLTVRQEVFFHARTVKYKDELDDPRVKEKFEIERRYWDRRDIEWGYVTEDDLPPALIENALLLHPFYCTSDLYPLMEKDVRRISFYLTGRVRAEETSIEEIASDCDQKFGLTAGQSFAVICHLIARSIWRVDLLRPIRFNGRLVLL